MKHKTMKFKEIPAISILKGSIVIAHSGRYETLTIDEKVPDALDLIELITENYEIVYITDLNGLMDGKPQVKFIHKLTDFCEVWLDTGVVEAEQIYDLFVAGTSEVILSSKTINGLTEVARAYELSDNLIFQIDYDDGIISLNKPLGAMDPQELVQELNDIGIQKIIFADLSRIESNKRLDTDIIQKLVTSGSNIYVGGGVKVNELRTLKQLGSTGAILELVDVLKHGKVDF